MHMVLNLLFFIVVVSYVFFTQSLMVASQAVTDSKVHGANMGPTWGRQDPGGSHVGHVNLAIWGGK